MKRCNISALEELLKSNKEGDATISISHKLYGNAQKIRLKPDYIIDETRIGFKLKNGQEIFIYKKDIVDCGTKDDIYFSDNLMEIKIRLHKQ